MDSRRGRKRVPLAGALVADRSTGHLQPLRQRNPIYAYPGAAKPASFPEPELHHTPRPFHHGFRAPACPANTLSTIAASRSVSRVLRRQPVPFGRTFRTYDVLRDAAVTVHRFRKPDQRIPIMRSSRRSVDILPDRQAVRGVTREHLHRLFVPLPFSTAGNCHSRSSLNYTRAELTTLPGKNVRTTRTVM